MSESKISGGASTAGTGAPLSESTCNTSNTAVAATASSTHESSITATTYGFDDQNLFEALNIISKLQPYDRLCTGVLTAGVPLKSGQVYISRSSIGRWYHGESRTSNINAIKEIFQRAIGMLNRAIHMRASASRDAQRQAFGSSHMSYAARVGASSHAHHSTAASGSSSSSSSAASTASPACSSSAPLSLAPAQLIPVSQQLTSEMMRCIQIDQFITRMCETIRTARSSFDRLRTTYADCATTTEQLNVIEKCIDDALVQIQCKLNQQYPPQSYSFESRATAASNGSGMPAANPSAAGPAFLPPPPTVVYTTASSNTAALAALPSCTNPTTACLSAISSHKAVAASGSAATSNTHVSHPVSSP